MAQHIEEQHDQQNAVMLPPLRWGCAVIEPERPLSNPVLATEWQSTDKLVKRRMFHLQDPKTF